MLINVAWMNVNDAIKGMQVQKYINILALFQYSSRNNQIDFHKKCSSKDHVAIKHKKKWNHVNLHFLETDWRLQKF